MGISLDTAVAIYNGCKDRNITGSAITLGKQDLDFGLDAFLVALSDAGRLPPRTGNQVSVLPDQMIVIEEFRANGRMHSTNPLVGENKWLSDEFLFRFAGFNSVLSVDYSSFEGADIAHDLNDLGLSSKVAPCNFLYDGGTMEHIFHVPNVLRNIFDVLAVGGWKLHHSPANGMVDHGFYQFSPTLLWDYHHANAYDDIKVSFGVNLRGIGFGRAYAPGSLRSASPGGLDGSEYSTECWARKGPATLADRTPQQGAYVQLWEWKKQTGN